MISFAKIQEQRKGDCMIPEYRVKKLKNGKIRHSVDILFEIGDIVYCIAPYPFGGNLMSPLEAWFCHYKMKIESIVLDKEESTIIGEIISEGGQWSGTETGVVRWQNQTGEINPNYAFKTTGEANEACAIRNKGMKNIKEKIKNRIKEGKYDDSFEYKGRELEDVINKDGKYEYVFVD